MHLNARVVGATLGVLLGATLGEIDGANVEGDNVGLTDGWDDGLRDGFLVVLVFGEFFGVGELGLTGFLVGLFVGRFVVEGGKFPRVG